MLIRLRVNSVRIPLVAALAAGTFAGDCGQAPQAGDCVDENGNSEVRVHVGNPGLLSGLRVELTTATEQCVIDPLSTDPSEFSQVVMLAQAGTSIGFHVNGMAVGACVVAADAFLNLPPGAENGQTFASVYGGTSPSLTCDSGWE